MGAYGTLSLERVAVSVKINKWIDKKTKLITGECSDGWTHKQTDRQTARMIFTKNTQPEGLTNSRTDRVLNYNIDEPHIDKKIRFF